MPSASACAAHGPSSQAVASSPRPLALERVAPDSTEPQIRACSHSTPTLAHSGAQAAELRSALLEAQAAGKGYRMRVSGPPFMLGCAFCSVGLALFVSNTWGTPLFWLGFHMGVIAVPFLLMALRPTDAFLVRAFGIFWTGGLSLFAGAASYVAVPIAASSVWAAECISRVQARTLVLVLLALAGTALGTVAFVWHAVLSSSTRLAQRCLGLRARRLTTRSLLESLWLAIGRVNAIFGLLMAYWFVYLGVAFPPYHRSSNFWAELSICANFALCTALALTPAVRSRVHAILAARGEGVSAAAGVASLIGGISAEEAIARGRSRMRAIPADRLDASLFAQNQPGNNDWYRRSLSADLDSVDAFVSHSWHDPAGPKYSALLAWCAQFRREHSGREPRLWFDRACIDQQDVSADLPFLPVYLAGCKKLLILAGPTYLERLWCVTELFVFEQMHRAHTRRRGAAGWPPPPPGAGAAAACAAKRGWSARTLGSRSSSGSHASAAAAGAARQPELERSVGSARAPSVGSTREGSVEMIMLPGGDAAAFSAFAVQASRCAKREDEDRLLACIEAACGSLESFNESARQLLVRAHMQSVSRRESGAAAPPSLRACESTGSAGVVASPSPLRAKLPKRAWRPSAEGAGLKPPGGGGVRGMGYAAVTPSPARGGDDAAAGRAGVDVEWGAGHGAATPPAARGAAAPDGAAHALSPSSPSARAPAADGGAAARGALLHRTRRARRAAGAIVAGVLILFAAGWIIAVPADADCAACAQLLSGLPTDARGWTTRDGRQYRFSGRRGRRLGEEPTSFAGARQACAAEGARLVSLGSAREEATVRCLIGDYALGVWIGLSQPSGSAQPSAGWRWEDGRALGEGGASHVNWAAGMPDHGATTPLGALGARDHGENCARIGVGGWFDERCDFDFAYAFAYVCERGATVAPDPERPRAGGAP